MAYKRKRTGVPIVTARDLLCDEELSEGLESASEAEVEATGEPEIFSEPEEECSGYPFPEEGVCCFCKGPCNPCSQACGICIRSPLRIYNFHICDVEEKNNFLEELDLAFLKISLLLKRKATVSKYNREKYNRGTAHLSQAEKLLEEAFTELI